MTRPFSLQTVLDLMQARTDEATRNLARLIANEKDAKARLDMLLGYRDEYAGRFREAAQNGLTQREWQNFQHFLGRLDDAIEQQTASSPCRCGIPPPASCSGSSSGKSSRPSTRCRSGISPAKARAR